MYKAAGQLTEIKPVESISSKNGAEYSKLVFIIKNNDGYEGAQKTLAFEIFEKSEGTRIENFKKYNSVGDFVEVSFDVDCNEGKGKAEGRYFVSLKAFRIDQDKDNADNTLAGGHVAEAADEEVPF